uniref:Uncharacterized protein n=1 Tax=Meloidogyne incognita TaxID=6306 RepID=A0A914M2X6_MELIC
MEPDARHVYESIRTCLDHLKTLKNIVLTSHNLLVGRLATQQNSEEIPNLESVLQECEKLGGLMAVEYERLENEAKKLPQQTPSSLMVNKLNNFLLDCAMNPQIKSDYDNTMSVFEWTDSTAVCFVFIKLSGKTSLFYKF